MSFEAGFDLAKRLHDDGETDLNVDLRRMPKDYKRGYREYVSTLNNLTKDKS